MTLDVLADADEVAARAAKAAGVVVRELESLAELEAMTALFDEIWEPDAANPSMRLDLLRAMTKAGNYASGAYIPGPLSPRHEQSVAYFQGQVLEALRGHQAKAAE